MIDETVKRKLQRMRRFFCEPGRGKLLVQLCVPGQDLCDAQLLPEHLEGGWQPYLERRAEQFAAFVEGRAWLDDDWLPVLHPWYGAAELAAYLPARVEFGAGTCWTIPSLPSAREFAPPLIDAASALLRNHLEVLAFVRSLAEGRFLVGLRGTYSPLEVASALVGSNLLYDLVDSAEALEGLLSAAVEAAAWHTQRQLEATGLYDGGTVNGYLKLWFPGKCAVHVIEDFACLISTEMFQRFGAPADAQLFARFDGGQVHTHNLGWHQLRAFARIPGILMVEIAEDPNVQPTVERLPELFEAVGEVPVFLTLSADQFRTSVPQLALGNAVVRVAEPLSRREALELLSLARERWRA